MRQDFLTFASGSACDVVGGAGSGVVAAGRASSGVFFATGLAVVGDDLLA